MIFEVGIIVYLISLCSHTYNIYYGVYPMGTFSKLLDLLFYPIALAALILNPSWVLVGAITVSTIYEGGNALRHLWRKFSERKDS